MACLLIKKSNKEDVMILLKNEILPLFLWKLLGKDCISIPFLILFFLCLNLFTVNVYAMGPSINNNDIKDHQIDDKDITREIETELSNDSSVSAHLIDVETNNGIVTLSGFIDNLLSRDRAVKIAETVKGVRSIVNLISVNPPLRSDKEILRSINDAFFDDPVIERYELDVKVENGIATLLGKVDSFAESQIAQQIVKGVKGVKDVRNKLELTYKGERVDSEIKVEVERRLKMDPYVKSHLIDVDVTNGQVKLNGIVGSLSEQTRAYADAWVTGVKSVDVEQLNVSWWVYDAMQRENQFITKTDREIEDAVKDALLYDPRVMLFDINVEVKNKVVTLNGVVNNLLAKRAAEQDTMNTLGVWNVENYIKVRPHVLSTNEEIKKKVNKALKTDPYIERHDVRINVLNNKVYLYGAVDTSFEKYHAYNVVAKVPGVVKVENRIKVIDPWVWRNDETIKENIERELFWDASLDSNDITVEVEDGVATLTGIVRSIQEKNAAIENAFDGGANIVRNHLKVKGAQGYYQEYYHRDFYLERF
jgi:osmotically-inducible protein OsmY